MPIELAHDPVLSDSDILDCVTATPFDPADRSLYLIRLGRALEQKVLHAIEKRGQHAAGSALRADSVTNAHARALAGAGY